MFFRTSIFASLVVACCMATPSQAQLVKQLGRLPFAGKVKQASFLGGGCDSCAAAPSCGAAGCSAGGSCLGGGGGGCADTGCAAPSCGLAGSILGSCLGGGGSGCGALPEPSCGSHGLGYSGGFGLCGGSCDSCGDGGYLGRNLYKVNPCACGGSLIGDMARGFVSLVDRTVGTLVGTVFGGLQTATCHASGTFAALQSAATVGCSSCGSMGCDSGGCAGGPSCGLNAPSCGCAAPSCGAPACGAPAQLASPPAYSAPSYPVESSYPSTSYPSASYPTNSIVPSATSYGSEVYSQPTPPAPSAPIMDAVPLPQGEPTLAPTMDPFVDDPVLPQVRNQIRAAPTGFRVFNDPAPAPRGYAQRSTSPVGSAVRPAAHTAQVSPGYAPRMTTSRPLTLRR